MTGKKPEFKRPSKKHQPKGLTILFEDHDIIVVNKIHGLLTVSTEREKEKTAFFLLNDYVKKGNSQSRKRVFIVHRLDRETSGVLVFAKTQEAKRFLQDEWASFSKKYIAVVHGTLTEKEGIITSYLLENKAHQVYAAGESSGGKFAKTAYRVIKEFRHTSLLEVTLFTGRKNQIRVHFADLGHPIVGDKMYGKPEKGKKRLALHAQSLSFRHPFTKEEMVFETEMPVGFG